MPACTSSNQKPRAARPPLSARARRGRAGFTMVEMLTVIAIIAVLSAVLFPVMAAVRRTVWKSRCMNNMHQLSQAIDLYQDSWNRYPLVLDAVVINNQAAQPLRPLFPLYAKSEDIFRCPINAYRSSDLNQTGFAAGQLTPAAQTVKRFPATGPLRACLDSRGGPKSLRVSACNANETAATPVQFPLRDSYDGAFVPNDVSRQWEVHYSRDWTEVAPTQGATDIPRQLKYRFPPSNTVITWCLNHYDSFDAQGIPHGPVPTLFRDGSVKQLRAERFVQWAQDGNTWRVYP